MHVGAVKTVHRMRLWAALLLVVGGCAWVNATEEAARLDTDNDGATWLEDCDPSDPEVSAETTWYADEDGDGHGDADRPFDDCILRAGYSAFADDCDDTAPGVNPEADELCDGFDNDCDGLIDEEDPDLDLTQHAWYADVDQDGYGDVDSVVFACEKPDGYVDIVGDCDDDDDDVSPDGEEFCDGVDNDCDGVVDEEDALDAALWFEDADGDGWGDAGSFTMACDEAPSGFVDNPLDCDDSDAAIAPDAREVCDGIDNNCDTRIDDADPWIEGQEDWFLDRDGDGFGNNVQVLRACSAPSGAVDNRLDCWDDDPSINPAAIEVCDGIDNDCDGLVDDDDSSLDPTSPPDWFLDSDGDGFGDGLVESPPSCDQPGGYVPDDTDCDDSDPALSPGAPELCDGIDNDCNNLIDETAPETWHLDADGDGFGDLTQPLVSCSPPPGYVFDDSDCDDGNNALNPSAAEICDGIDNDCDSLVDDSDDPFEGVFFYEDGDGDGFGSDFVIVEACTAPPGFVADGGDCADGDPLLLPGAFEDCDGLDNDCDGFIDDDDPEGAGFLPWYLDADLDGFGDDTEAVLMCDQPVGFVGTPGDCDDAAMAVNPLAVEICDGIDNDCDGDIDDADTDVDLATGEFWYFDADDDGFGDPLDVTGPSCAPPSGYVAEDSDCDDTDPTIFPDAPELCDALDNDCDLLVDEDTPTPWYLDSDGDGFGDPTDVAVSCMPLAGRVLDSTDCDDTNAAVFPGAAELCNGIDDDCDALVDDDDPDVQGLLWHQDFDGDLFGDPALELLSCIAPAGWVADGTDCDDGDPAVNTAAVEVCNGIDDDCNWLADDAAVGAPFWYLDGDGDGFGDALIALEACVSPPGWVASSADCDDADFQINPSATEMCDGFDNDCDLLVDDADAPVVGGVSWYADSDSDGYGDAGNAVVACDPPSGFVGNFLDCDDADTAVNPGAAPGPADVEDGVDRDCDGFDECFLDLDGDGFGTGSIIADDGVPGCTGSGESGFDDDCDDADIDVFVGQVEDCFDSIDNDCDLAVDAADSDCGPPTCYADTDGDGFGSAVIIPDDGDGVCDGPGEAPAPDDCDDSDPAANPNGNEMAGNLVDEDCDGFIDCFSDGDMDGYGGEVALVQSPDAFCDTAQGESMIKGDCDDSDPNINIGAPEICGNGADEDCDGADAICVPWEDADCLHRMDFTMLNTAHGRLMDFPVRVALHSGRIDYALLDRDNLRFRDDDGALLDHDEDSWDDLGTSNWWVRIPQVDGASSDDRFWLYFDCSTAAVKDYTAVWPGYSGVWHHLPSTKDSTANGNDESTSNTNNVAGLIGRAQETTGQLDSYLEAGGDPSLENTADITVSSLVSPSQLVAGDFENVIIARGTDTEDSRSNYHYWLSIRQDGTLLAYWEYGYGIDLEVTSTVPAPVIPGTFHTVAFVRDLSARELSFYFDGAKLGVAVPFSNPPDGGADGFVTLGSDPGCKGCVQNKLDGYLDEVRIDPVARDADWMNAQDQTFKDGFLIYGIPE